MSLAAKEKIDSLLKWLMSQVNSYPGVNVKNFTSSWKNGKALYALMHSLLGSDVIPKDGMSDDVRNNFTIALDVALKARVPALLEVEDLCDFPIDRLCMITYLHTVYKILYLQKQNPKRYQDDEPIESENPFTKPENCSA